MIESCSQSPIALYIRLFYKQDDKWIEWNKYTVYCPLYRAVLQTVARVLADSQHQVYCPLYRAVLQTDGKDPV